MAGSVLFPLCAQIEAYPEYTTYEYRTMFDEVYHARTAYEMLHRLPIYENTHPPLGKYLMSLEIRIFGMTSFGWRIVCALMGTLMVPVCYAFYAVEDRDDRCDCGIFYSSDLLSDVSGAGEIKEGIELPCECSHGVKRSVCRCGDGIDIWKSGDLVGRNSGPVLSCNIRISGKESVLRTMAGKLGALIGTEPEYFFLPFFPK